MGQHAVKRALEIAAAGGHNIILSGPPGSGKSMMAKCFPTILPPLSDAERLEVIRVWSAVGRGQEAVGRAERPFRAPHHNSSANAVAGGAGAGGRLPVPGEVTLAHHGVLFLDELPEFHRDVLETPAPAARRRQNHHLARRRSGDLSGTFSIHRSDEPLQMRLVRQRPLHLHPGCRSAVPAPSVRSAARPNRPADRGTAGRIRGAGRTRTGQRGTLGRDSCRVCRRPRAAVRATGCRRLCNATIPPPQLASTAR